MWEALRSDPETGSWVKEKGDQRQLSRIWDKAASDNDALPTITVRAGLRHEAADAGLAALEAAGTAFYQRGEQIVRVSAIAAKTADGTQTVAPGIVPVSHAVLGRELGRSALWEGFDRKGDPVRIDPPRPVVEQIADMAGEWPFPILAGVIGTPTMRGDGSLLLDQGYDEQTGLVLLGAPAIPPIPGRPTQEDAECALQTVDGLLDEFPFKDGSGPKSVDRAVALSELLTPVLRGAMPTAPMHLANAPQPGTGKSYLADLASCIATGERCAVVAFSPSPEETEKRLNGSALGGHPILALDNASGTIEGDLLCQITERPLLQLRPLGTSRMVRVANTFTVLANGNNAQVAADMVRRTIECRLDANMETPEARVFRDNPLATITRHRGTYIAAALTIARAYFCAGKPGRLPTLASYEAWSDTVRSPLVWLGRADPVASMASLRSVDPSRLIRASVFRAWADELGTNGAHQTADVINRANDQGPFGAYVRPNLHAVLLEIGRDRVGGIEATRVGKWLSRNENNVADRLKLTCDRGDAARPRWVLRET
jgi:putative DNA primase/helicase